ncbi:MAG: glycosyltransferase [Candidatus Lokiarchaeota archaeon]
MRFGYTGRIIPVKGIDLLIKCFNEIDPKKASLNIYGKLDNGVHYLKKMVKNSNIFFHGGYNYWDIDKVLSNLDVLVVPSIWYENSPLVIHEAGLAKIPVITSNLGGMAELIIDGKNGFLFEPRNVDDLRDKIYRFINQPELIEAMSQDSSHIRSIQEDARDLIKIYKKLGKKEELNQIAI